MPTRDLLHLGHVEGRRYRRGDERSGDRGWVSEARCICGWVGPGRTYAITAADDMARHLLDVAS